MRALYLLLLALVWSGSGAQTLKSVSNADNDLKKHQQVLASRLLSWSTGSQEQINYVSVGRYANYFGFVKMRVSSAHSLKRSEVGRETLSVLTEEQQEVLFTLLEQQSDYISATHASRLKANAFLNELLSGKRGLNEKQSFLQLAADYAIKEAALGRMLGAGFSKIIQSFESRQSEQLSTIRNKHTSGRTSKISYNPPSLKALSREEKQEIFNLSARLLSWSTGELEDFSYETIGKPSQHFGFVSLRVDSNHGVKRGVIADEVVSILSTEQREKLASAAVRDRDNLKEYLSVRKLFLKELAALRDDTAHDLSRWERYANDMAMSEANMTWDQALALKEILDSFSPAQLQQLFEQRNAYIPAGVAVGGSEIYRQCAACHANTAIAPGLESIINRPVAGADYNYSPAMREFSRQYAVWSRELLHLFLKNPQRLIPGTTMSYKGMGDDNQIQSLIDYLEISGVTQPEG